ncbi:hypothetical protein [uncultured Paracoccus sp.]|uniref:hypothetical protein n=1 Tax=uncultured Paracoccus sp. TaxID=189685 RepID=UPI002629267C|nr:hypothetical protein [uncultured Paracoccus sp.]
MTSTNDLMKHSRITIAPQADGSTHVIFDMQGWGADVICRYWRVANPGRSDPWRYELAAINGPAETWPHPTEQGCKIAIIRHLINAGLIEIPEDNGHLDDRNRIELAAIHDARAHPGPRPVVGDFVIMPDGSLERCCHATEYGMQTTEGGSFNVMRGGTASYSGGLNKPRLWEGFKPTGETRPGRFWFFSHGKAGAGRGVDCFLPCRVFRLEPKTMSREDARAHPLAQIAAEIFGVESWDHQSRISRLMIGDA